MLDTELILFLLKTLPHIWFTAGVLFIVFITLEITIIIRKNREVKRLQQVINNMKMILDVPIKEARKILNDIERSNHNGDSRDKR